MANAQHLLPSWEATCPLFGLKSPQTASDAVHGGHAVFLNVSLSQLCPALSRSQMPRACPARLIHAFGRARTWMTLSASEVEVEKAANKNAHAATHLSFKCRDVIKCFACFRPIGETLDGLLAQDGNCGSLLVDSLDAALMSLFDCAWASGECGQGLSHGQGARAEIDTGCAACSLKKLKNKSDAATGRRCGPGTVDRSTPHCGATSRTCKSHVASA